MKLVQSLLAAALLLALAPAALAADPSPAEAGTAEVAPTPPAETIELGDLFAASDDCSAGEPAEAALDGGDEIELASQVCGSCSESICQGAIRGQFCGAGKHCNIFSGGLRCSTGGWKCECRGGVLP